ncbi:MAG: glucokinase, partial [Pseudomonadota bacterium]
MQTTQLDQSEPPDLVADIGGTNARFALARRGAGGVEIIEPQSFRARDFETVGDAARAYLAAGGVEPRAVAPVVVAAADPVDVAAGSLAGAEAEGRPQ